MSETKTLLRDADQAAHQLADGAAAQADHAIEATRHGANEVLDRLQRGIDELRGQAPSLMDRAASQVENLTRRGMQRAREVGGDLREQASQVGDRTTSYIRDEPVKSVLMAAAAGAALAALVGWMARSRSEHR